MKFLEGYSGPGHKKKKDILISEIYHQHVNGLFAFGKTFTNQDELIKDCIQDLFFYLIDNPEKVNEIRNIKQYLYTMFRNELIRTLKGRKAWNYYSDAEDLNFKDKTYSLNAVLMEFDINDQMLNKKLIVNEVLTTLTKKQRTIIYLRYHDQLSYEDICKILSINYQSARTLIYRAIQKIRKIISEKKLANFN